MSEGLSTYDTLRSVLCWRLAASRGSTGTALSPRNLNRAWSKARAAAGCTDLHLHDLRHSGLTWAAASGASVAELMRRGGHANPRAALRYQHATEDRDRAIADALARLAKVDRILSAMDARYGLPGSRRAGALTPAELHFLWSGRRDSNPRPSPWQGCRIRPARPDTSAELGLVRFGVQPVHSRPGRRRALYHARGAPDLQTARPQSEASQGRLSTTNRAGESSVRVF